MSTKNRVVASLAHDESIDWRSAFDLCLLYGPVLVLIWVHQLPWELRRNLVLSYTNPTLLTIYTSHFVHLTQRHVATNLIGYTLIATTVYILHRQAGTTRCFRRAAITLLFVLPFTLSALNLIYIRPHIGFGFSGVVMGYYGVLPLALFRYLETTFEWTLRLRDAPFLFFTGITAIALTVGTLTDITAVIAIGAGAVTLLYACSIVAKTDGLDTSIRSVNVPGAPGEAETALAGFAIFLLFPLVAFPPDPVGDNSILNIYTHLLGYCLSFITAFSTWAVIQSQT